MGLSWSACFPRILSIHDAEEEEEIVKVVRATDGELFEYPGPVSVKDLMHGFEGFAVFHYNTVKQPLPPETELKFSEVYYLRPWISQKETEKALRDPESGMKPGGLRTPERSVETGQEKKAKKVRFLDEERRGTQDVPNAGNEAARCKNLLDSFPGSEVLPLEEKGVVRLKLVISKKQLFELMSTTTQKPDALQERIMAPLMSPRAPDLLEDAESLSPASSWAPSLQQIPEAR